MGFIFGEFRKPLNISVPDEPSYYRPPRQRLKSLMKQPEFYYNPAQAAAKLPPHKLPKILLTKAFQKKKRGRPRKYARPEDLAHPERLDLMASPPRDESAFIFLRKLQGNRAQNPGTTSFLTRRAEFDAVNALMGLRNKGQVSTKIKSEPGIHPPGSPGYHRSFDFSPAYGADRTCRTRSASTSPRFSPYPTSVPALEPARASQPWAQAPSQPSRPTDENADPSKKTYMAILDRKRRPNDPEWKPGSRQRKTKNELR